MIRMSLSALFALASLAATGTATAATQTSVAYSCDAGSKASALYDTTTLQGGVVVVFGGNTLAFASAPSGSGARYLTAVGAHTITPLEWWTKGRDATLSEVATHGGNRLIATCHQAR